MEITSVIGDRRWACPPVPFLPARSLRAPEGLAPSTTCICRRTSAECVLRTCLYSLPSALRNDQYIPQQGILGPRPCRHQFKAVASRYIWLQCLKLHLSKWRAIFIGHCNDSAQALALGFSRIQVPQIHVKASQERAPLPSRHLFKLHSSRMQNSRRVIRCRPKHTTLSDPTSNPKPYRRSTDFPFGSSWIAWTIASRSGS